MKLTDKVCGAFKVSKIFRDNSDKINHVDFSPDGTRLITSSDDDSIVLYDCVKGVQLKTSNSKKYGVSFIQFTHGTNAVLHGSTKLDDTIRYLSLHDNKYLRYFSGHTKSVVCLNMSPVDDTFISASLDKTIRLWDLRSPDCQGLMHTGAKPVTAFDQEGLIFAAGVDAETLRLYDLRSFDKGPFTTFNLPSQGAHQSRDPNTELTGIKFSNDGKKCLVSTSQGNIHLLDAFQGLHLHSFGGICPGLTSGVDVEASFSPDSQFVLSGSTDGKVHIWSTDSGKCVAHLDGLHPGCVKCTRFNPKYMTFVTACMNLAFWLPDMSELEK